MGNKEEIGIEKLTIKAKVLLMLLSSQHCLSFLKERPSLVFDIEEVMEINGWFLQSFENIVKWLEGYSIEGEIFYKEFIYSKVANYNGYYNHYQQPKESDAYNCCLSTLYFSCKSIMMFSNKDYNKFPSDIAEVTDNTVIRCLIFSQQASLDPELEKQWQERVLDRLLKDHLEKELDEFGSTISRHYINDLLGQKLPF
ncbi:hypothetical protein QNI19_05830 [Cytophagaceae bacterium DM2B3-1]|uniref:Uncharacterized protein n=1 Tax=Xanthocytophaga flava TaxID=3048013 RepID=A0ABT7CHH6_9BACT|nr:hypothetical protein [Xanthocytophaga flavus]MDJ1470993.1 hypothetical protein [Xanthocytophaga flavus]MDJ1492440.1 hypothetical protein [Xanthocytophaga flavus]